jgi:hypothetical protein
MHLSRLWWWAYKVQEGGGGGEKSKREKLGLGFWTGGVKLQRRCLLIGRVTRCCDLNSMCRTGPAGPMQNLGKQDTIPL